MAVASALQNEMMMHAGIETTNNTAITLAKQKLTQTVAEKKPDEIENWMKALETLIKSRQDEAESLAAFNKLHKIWLTSFPKATNGKLTTTARCHGRYPFVACCRVF